MAKVVAFCGAHGTGKSTLVEELCKDPKYIQIISATRSNTNQEERRIDPDLDLDQTQLRILEAMQAKVPDVLKLKDDPKTSDQIIVLDRSAIDFYAYSTVFSIENRIRHSTLEKIDNAIWNLINYIDLFFYLPIEFALVDDGVRNMDEGLRRAVDYLIREQLFRYGHTVELRGTMQHRLTKFKNAINLL